MYRARRLIRCILLAGLSILPVAACGHTETPAENIPPWGISFRWSAEPGIDLESAEMKVVRATIESNTVAMFLNVDYGYPGWRDAGTDNVDSDASAPHPMIEGIGTAYLHVVKYRTAGGEVNVVCKDMSNTAKKIGDRYPFPNQNDPRETLEAIAVNVGGDFTANSAHPDPAKTPEGPDIPGPQGRHPRPQHNVFSQFSFVFYPHGGLQYHDLCLPWAESRWGGPRPPKPARTESEPPEIEPFTPGWTE